MKKIVTFLIIAVSLTIVIMVSSLIDDPEIEPHAASLLNPLFSNDGGFYTDNFYLTLTPQEGTTIHYTLDGSEPTMNSPIYDQPLWIEKQLIAATGEEIRIQREDPDLASYPTPEYPISYIRTGTDEWKSPSDDIFKATTLKVKAYNALGDGSDIITQTYFVDPHMDTKYTYPIISITTDINNLYDYETGINVPGIYYDPTIPEVDNDNRTGNYFQTGDAWEKPVYVEMYDTSGTRVIAQDAGLRVHGGLSRKYPVKSYRLYARSEYDTENYFDYQFFDDDDQSLFKRLILRAGGQAYKYTFMGEAAAEGLLTNLNLEYQNSTPVILFLNGEYFGIRNIRDRLDEWHLQLKYDIPREDITILAGHGAYASGLASGSAHYLNMYSYITTHDMSSSRNYEQASTMMDMDNFIDYYVTEIYMANADWPQNNIEYWRYNIAYNKNETAGRDGRWRWMVFDLDASFGASWGGYYPEFNQFNRLTGDSWKTGALWIHLLQNESFRLKFINRMLDLLNTDFSSEHASTHVQNMIDLYAPEMVEHIAYYGYPQTYQQWYTYVYRMKAFATERPENLLSQMQVFFGIGEPFQLVVEAEDEQANVRLNSLDLSTDIGEPWSGTYLTDVSVTLEAKPKDGFRLVGWYNQNNELLSESLTYSFVPIEDTYVRPVFEVGTQIYPEEPMSTETIVYLVFFASIVTVIGIALTIEMIRRKRGII